MKKSSPSAVTGGLLSIWEGFSRGQPQVFILGPVLFTTSLYTLDDRPWVCFHGLVTISGWEKVQSALKDGKSTENKPQKLQKQLKTDQTRYKPGNHKVVQSAKGNLTRNEN